MQKNGNLKLEVVSIIIHLHKKPTNMSCQNLSKRYSNIYIKNYIIDSFKQIKLLHHTKDDLHATIHIHMHMKYC
jgi:hypothetical protein